jgi:ATP-binding cassette subfamily C protein LapB
MKQFGSTLLKLAQLQGDTVDRLSLQEVLEKIPADAQLPPLEKLNIITDGLLVKRAILVEHPSNTDTPALLFDSYSVTWGLLRGKNAQGAWVSEWLDDKTHQVLERTLEDELDGICVYRLHLAKPYEATKSPVFQMIKNQILVFKKQLIEATLGGVAINLVGLATSFLYVLTFGVLATVIFELIAKHIRAGLYEHVVEEVDKRLSRAVYSRFLSIRLDQLPRSVGSLSSQLRGYETVRGFMTSATTSLLVDAPFALLFIILIMLIGGPIALVPLLFFAVALAMGIYFRKEIESLAGQSNVASNFKTGLLVETVEGAETIKSGQGGWRMLTKWMHVTDNARTYELKMRQITENSQHLTGAFQQLSYILLVAAGAALVVSGHLTMGGLIACSILSGRILTPVAALPGLLIQWANAKASLKSLDVIWNLQDDHAGIDQPLVPEHIQGNYVLDDAKVFYADRPAFAATQLTIRAGEKVGILGPVGAGKTTLLRLLTGMYRPQQGRVLLDGLDISHISKPILSEAIGYLQQDGRLFAGTLRENLILGLIDPGDDTIIEAAKATGLYEAVLLRHPKGMQQEIFEGGTGLSGGQRQLLNLTRVLLRQPKIWLLDEPTSSMDRPHEVKVMQTLHTKVGPTDTLVLITHKPEMLQLINRLIVVVNHQIIMDGPRDEVLQKLQTPAPNPAMAPATPAPNAPTPPMAVPA